jgi:hypothetical protein
MNLVSRNKWLVWSLFFLFVGACAQLGLQKARNFTDEWAYAMAVNTGIRNASVEALNKKALTPEEMRDVIEFNGRARKILDEAEAVRKTDPKLAENKLAFAMSVIEAVQQYMNQRGVQVPKPKSGGSK